MARVVTWQNPTAGLRTKSEYAYPINNTKGFDLWINDTDGPLLYVPFDVNGNSIKTAGDTIAGYIWDSKVQGTKEGHNGSEMVYNQPAVADLIAHNKKFTDQYEFDGANTPLDYGYGKIDFNREGLNIEFADIVSKDPVIFNMIKYASVQSGGTKNEIYKFVNAPIVLYNGEEVTYNGEFVTYNNF